MRQWIKQTLGGGDYARVPERITGAIRDQQDASERLIGWIQLSVVLTFATLYAISPKTFVAGAVPFQPVPWALGIYLGLTVIRLVWSHLARLPAWVLALSVVIDITLLMVLIWSFHLQYGQPASFYLKAPTLLYVFIFIALRALRFEVWYVALTGSVAGTGWLALVLYAVTIDPQDAMITRNYVQYLTSNSVLLGAEFDKVISIVVVTVILAVALARARRLLVRSVVEHTAASDLSRFFAPEIAEKIKGAEHRIGAGHGEAREAAILNVDIRGFTVLAETTAPSMLMQLLAEYQSRMVPVIQRHGGSIDKFLGDGIMATFGAAVASDTHAADGLRAVDDVVATAEAWNAERRAAGLDPLRIGVALTTGRVVFGAVGDETRLEYTVIGDAVNLSAKLEKHNKVTETRALTTVNTYALAEAQGYRAPTRHETHPASQLMGVDHPVDLVVMAA
ncbi:MAG: adenylate/guanylate cyclase domain-containing protein [Kiloniellales bacterium]